MAINPSGLIDTGSRWEGSAPLVAALVPPHSVVLAEDLRL